MRRKRPRVYTAGEAAIAIAALGLHDAGEPERAESMLDAAGITADDLSAMDEAGLLGASAYAPERNEPWSAPVEEAPWPPYETGPAVVLPDGTDSTDTHVRARVEARVREAYGSHAVVMWPRFPDVEDGLAPILPVVLARGEAPQQVTLDDDVRPTDGPRLAAHGQMSGLGDLVEFDPYSRVAVFTHLDPGTRAVRDRIAGLLKADPWAVEVAVHKVIDEKSARERLDQVVILRAPTVGISAEKRASTWRDLLLTVPGGTDGWEALDEAVTGVVRLRYGQPRTLPGVVEMATLLPPSLDTSCWSRLPLGLDPAGREACIDLTAGPHTLVVGPTGSGKSVFLRQHAAAALAHGHGLIVIDAIKGGLDFLAFRPWCLAFGEDLTEARVLIEKVYAEGQRRKALLKAYGAPSWADLPPEVRRKERIFPLTVLFDEFMSAVIASPVPKGLDRDDPLVEEANRLNADKAVILAMVGKIARELRFSGIFLAIAMQRPDASLLAGFGEIRSNLTSAVQLVKPGSLPAQETLRMVFPGEQTQAAAEAIMELDDGRSKGLATIAAEGGDVTGFRVAFGVPSEIPGLLESLGVPKPRPWIVKGSDRESSSAPPQQSGVMDLGIIEVSIGDLEAPALDDDGAPLPEGPKVPLDDLW